MEVALYTRAAWLLQPPWHSAGPLHRALYAALRPLVLGAWALLGALLVWDIGLPGEAAVEAGGAGTMRAAESERQLRRAAHAVVRALLLKLGVRVGSSATHPRPASWIPPHTCVMHTIGCSQCAAQRWRV